MLTCRLQQCQKRLSAQKPTLNSTHFIIGPASTIQHQNHRCTSAKSSAPAQKLSHLLITDNTVKTSPAKERFQSQARLSTPYKRGRSFSQADTGDGLVFPGRE
jgi:hypothetical protein